MADKKCPRCGLWNSSVALRCDCGYDFESGMVEASYNRQKYPAFLKTYFSVFLFALGFAVIVILVEAFSTRDFFATAKSLFVAIVGFSFYFYLYFRFLKKENWARILLAILFFPFGLYLLFSEEVRMFMLQSDE